MGVSFLKIFYWKLRKPRVNTCQKCVRLNAKFGRINFCWKQTCVICQIWIFHWKFHHENRRMQQISFLFSLFVQVIAFFRPLSFIMINCICCRGSKNMLISLRGQLSQKVSRNQGRKKIEFVLHLEDFLRIYFENVMVVIHSLLKNVDKNFFKRWKAPIWKPV